MNINETSSYVDLAPLYGNNQEMQDKLRVRNGRGLLLPDVFAEERLLLFPPAICALLVLFSRNHNVSYSRYLFCYPCVMVSEKYIAAKLLEINERGTFVDPPPKDKEKLLKQEEELFQTARLINCGWFGTGIYLTYSLPNLLMTIFLVVFSDYFSTILGLVRDGNAWSLEPFEVGLTVLI